MKVCTHCGIVIVPELHCWIGSLSGSLHCQRSPSRRHEPVKPAEGRGDA